MEYSKIKSVDLKNFMAFKKAHIEFDETGMINIKGFNDSGKSAVMRAIAVCFLDKFSKKQTGFIHHNEDYFRVVVTFEDGISILRDKYINGQSLYEMYKGDELIFTSKQGNKLARIQGVPDVIAAYLGMCITDTTCFNYQSCVDVLPIVDTTGSENYQMLHVVLRMVELYRANNLINIDRNKKSSEITELEREYNDYTVLLEKCGDVTEDFLNELLKKEKESDALEAKKKVLKGVLTNLDELISLCDMPSVECLSTDKLGALNRVAKLLNDYTSIKDLPSLETLDVSRMKSLNNIGSLMSSLGVLKGIPEVSIVSTKNLQELEKVVINYSNYVKYYKLSQECDEELKKVQVALKGLVDQAGLEGIKFVKCANCGTYSSVDVGGHCNHE